MRGGQDLASRLNTRITIQQPARTTDVTGGASVSWGDLVSLWAEMRSLSRGDEKLFAGKIQAEAAMLFTIRARSDVTASMRILAKGKTYQIRRIDDVDGAGVILQILAEEGVA